MCEPAHHPPVPVGVFVRRLIGHFAIVLGLLSASIALGMLGFHYVAHYPWVDAFLAFRAFPPLPRSPPAASGSPRKGTPRRTARNLCNSRS